MSIKNIKIENGRSIIGGIFCGIVFESIISAPVRGFYFLPIVLAALLYSALPFTIQLLNACIALLFGFVFISGWALFLSEWHIVSFRYFLHLTIIMILCMIIIYASGAKKQKNR